MVQFKRKVYRHTAPVFGAFLNIPRVQSTSLWTPHMRPAAVFYGDSDGDGVMNGLDCSPFNRRLQGASHKLTPEQKAYNREMQERMRVEQTNKGLLHDADDMVIPIKNAKNTVIVKSRKIESFE